MVTVLSLWLPILIAAVLVLVVSSIIHTVLPYHRSDFGAVPDESAVREGLRAVPPGDYVVPHAASNEQRRTDEFKAKLKEGPVAFLTVLPRGEIGMAATLIQWFLYCLLIGIFAAYLAGRTLGPGADYLTAFRIAGTVAFAGYGLALLQNSIWFRRKWSSTLKSVFDALVYALLTAGTFGWLWPG
jgi:hypothetical protein